MPPGAISFTAQNFNVTEGNGQASATLTRTGGGDGVLSAKITVGDVTTSPADYFLSPGALDPTFITPPQISGGTASTYGYPTMVLQPDGKLLVAEVRGVWRLNTDGSLDTTFTAGNATNSGLYTVALQPDGKILIGGGFTTFNNQRANRIARLNSDGSLDTTFDAGAGPNESVTVIIVQPDGKLLVSGYFDSFNGTSTGYFGVTRLNSNGSLDSSFALSQGLNARAMALQPDGKILAGSSGGINRANPDGTIDPTFNAQFSGTYPWVLNIAIQPDGKILIVGTFDHVGGQIAYGVARLNADGSVDPTFNTGTGPDIVPQGLALQPDGKVLISGSFKSFNGTAVNGLVRLNTNGSLDTTFVPSINDLFGSTSVNNILLQPDGKVFIRGHLSAFGSNITNRYLARLSNDLFVTWAAGDTSDKTVNLPIVDDLLDEPDETLNLTIVPLTNGVSTGTYPSATLTITDNDVPPAITSPLPPGLVNLITSTSYSHTFTATGYPAPTFTVTSGTLPSGLTLSPSGVLSGTIFSGGLHNITVTASNGVGSPATQSFTIRVNNPPFPNSDSYNTAVNTPITVNAPGVLANDNDANGDPLTAALVVNPTSGSVVLNANGSFTYTPAPNFKGTDTFEYTVSDGYSTFNPGARVFINVLSGGTLQFPSGAGFSGREDAGSLQVQIIRLDGSFGATTVAYSTSDGTAHAGTDYTPVSGTVTFASGQTFGSFLVPIINDSTSEPNETINLTIANVTGTGTLGAQTTSVLTILNDDAPAVQFSQRTYDVGEGAGSLSLTVTRSGDQSIPFSVNYATSDPAGLQNCSLVNGTASSRCDYATSIGTLRFAANESSKIIFVPIIDDVYPEGTESFSIFLNTPSSPAVLGNQTLATIRISDNGNDSSTAANPIDLTPFFVREHYIDFLGREPDPAGYAGWQNVLNNCGVTIAEPCDRIEVSSAFYRSEEFQNRAYFIYRFYSLVGKIPLYNQFMPDFAKVSGFLTAQQLEANKVAFVNEFMTRTDYVNQYGTLNDPTVYVTALLQTVGLPNHPSKQTWIAGLSGSSPTLTKAQVLRSLAESGEVYQKYYNEAFVIMQYFGYLRRSADASYVHWIETMNSTGGDYRVMINGFVNSAEYRQRFGN
jgi:uncharacterized delta-60 repeat protein